MEQIPKPGEFYRHFKDKLYQIVTVATHSESGEQLVVYQALYGDYKVYARPVAMFMSPVDHVKYPDVLQANRFELVNLEETSAPVRTPVQEDSGWEGFHPMLMKFIEETDCDKHLEILAVMKDQLQQRDFNMIYTALDMIEEAGTLEEQYQSVRSQLLIKKKYLGSRLR